MRRSRWRWPLRVLALGYLTFLVVLPVGSIFFRAFQHGLGAAWDAVTTPDALHALWLTLLVVLIAVPLDTVFGVGVALILSRHRFRGAWLLDAFVDLPLAISPVIVGISLILVYGKTGWFGNWLAARGIEVIFSLPGIVMASATVALPDVVREVLPVLQEIGTDQEQAATTLGAKPFAIFRRITLPSIRSSLAYGVTLTTARVLGEFGGVIVVSGAIAGKTETLTLFISDSFDNLNIVGAYVGAVILALIALGVLALFARGQADHEHPKERRLRRWRSPSDPSPNVSGTLLPSTTSASMSPTAL
jgi:sulfate/thiosulfate transport system permease protein